MMRWMIAGVVFGAAALLGSCATMSEDECRAGAWGEKGHSDGMAGYPMTRLNDHVEACAKFQVAADPVAYSSAREDGLRSYCTFERGWNEGRVGNTYYGVCRPEEEAAFLPAYKDGQRLHVAEAAVEAADSALSSAAARVLDREEKLDAKQRELRQDGLSDEERQRIHDRIEEVRGEIRDARRAAREASNALDETRQEEDRVRFLLRGRYPV